MSAGDGATAVCVDALEAAVSAFPLVGVLVVVPVLGVVGCASVVLGGVELWFDCP